MMNNKRILITGASGFIGSAIVDKALDLGYETWAGIRLSSSKMFLRDSRINFIDLNYADKNVLKAQLQSFVKKHGRFDYIVHCAGLTKALNKSDFDKVNYMQTRNFVDTLIEIQAIPDSFFFMSTLGVVGPGDETHYTPIAANQTPNPNTSYGKSKLKAENYLKGIVDFPYVFLRPTGVYGPRDRDYLILIKSIKNGLEIRAGYKKQILSFIFVEDLVKIIFDCIEKGIHRKTYNISDGDSYTDIEFNEIVKDILQKKCTFKLKIPLWLVKPAAFISEQIAKLFGKSTTFNTDKYRIMKQRNWSCDISPLKNDIDFAPDYRLKEGVAKTIRWYKEQGWL